MTIEYIEQRDGGYWIAGTRVSLDSVVHAFVQGQTAESIAQSFPVLRLEQVYGAIAFYLANQSEIDAYLARAKRDFETQRRAARDADPMFYQKLAQARRSRCRRPNHESTLAAGGLGLYGTQNEWTNRICYLPL